MTRILALLIPLLLVAPAGVIHAQDSSSHLGFRVVLPTGELKDRFSSGFGFTGFTIYDLGQQVDGMFEASWHRLLAEDADSTATGTSAEDADVFAFAIGPVLDLDPLALGIKGGYFFGDINEWDLVPFVQAAMGRFSLGIEYKALGKSNWGAASVNFRWN